MARPFYLDLLGLQLLVTPDDGAGPLTAEVQRLMLEETMRFVEDATFGEPGDFASLLTAPTTWVNEELATYYGIPGVTGDAFVPVELDATRHAGILTQGSLLVSHGLGGSSHPFIRGVRIFRDLLCQELDPPPDTVEVPPPPEPMPDATTRERFDTINTTPSCAACHYETQQLGYALEHFDGSGLWRDTENGRPIDATGELTVTDAAGRFDGAAELAARIAASEDAKRCFGSQWLEYAQGRPLGPADACSQDQLARAFAEGNIRDLLISIALSDGFLYRPLVTP
jgi:hypothetical protein